MPNDLSPAVFLDRDGTIMRDVEYCDDAKDVHVFDGAADALQRLKDAGYKLVVITNQSGIGRGYFSEADYRAVADEVQRKLPMIDASYFCPHQPSDRCGCRKPEPQMIFDAQRDLQLDLSRSFFIGDKDIDAECARAAGVRPILVRTGLELPKESSVADLREAVDVILRDAR